eukprot:1138506-Pelagomonas_calceolata.AAC.16
MVLGWKAGNRCVWPQPEYEDLLSMFPGHVLPSLRAQVWMFACLEPGQSQELLQTRILAQCSTQQTTAGANFSAQEHTNFAQ